MDADSSRQVLLFGHTGTSMNPTLTAVDLLEVEPYGTRQPRRGDVIVFEAEGFDQPVAHRVIRLLDEGVMTRGDHATADDPWVIGRSEIVGKVVAACRGKRRRAVANGTSGLMRADALRCWWALRRMAGRVYRKLLCNDFYALSQKSLNQ